MGDKENDQLFETVPSIEVRIELPVPIFHQLEQVAREHNVSVELVVCAIVARSQTGLADGLGEPK